MIFKAFKSLLSEPAFVMSAAIGGEVKLPPYYWRFLVLRPFLDADEIKKSPLGRNFCPLFWVTNLLALVYITLGWLLVPGYYICKYAGIAWRANRARRIRAFCKEDGWPHLASLESGRRRVNYNFLDQSYERWGHRMDFARPEDDVEAAEKLAIWLRNEFSKRDYDYVDSLTVLRFLYFKKKYGDKAEVRLADLHRQAMEYCAKLLADEDEKRKRKLAKSQTKQENKTSYSSKLVALTPIIKKVVQGLLVCLLIAVVVFLGGIILAHLPDFIHFLGFIAGGIWSICCAFVDLFKVFLNREFWTYLLTGTGLIFTVYFVLQKMLDGVIDKILNTDYSSDEKKRPSVFVDEIIPRMKDESKADRLATLFLFAFEKGVMDPCEWIWDNVLCVVWNWIKFPFVLLKMVYSNHCPKITIDEEGN